MNWLIWMFVAALAAETATRLWLASRQLDAVRAHRDRVPEAFTGQIALADQRKAADYTDARVRLGRWATMFEFLIKMGLIVGGGLAAINALVDAWVSPSRLGGPLHGSLVIVAVFLALQALGLPFALWRTFQIEAQFGFNRMTPWLFAVDLAKRLVLGCVIGVPVVLLTLWLMLAAGERWWVWAWVAYLGVTVFMTWAAPQFIAPLFNKFTAVTDATLKGRVESLLERCGFRAGGGVYVMDGSRRSGHGNAYFTGIGSNKRIVFFDTLLQRIDLKEIEAVLAHELGHFRLHHVRQRLITSMLATLGGLALLGMLARQPEFYRAFGVPQSPEMALLLFVLGVPAFTFFATPVIAWWSRRQEIAADDFAVRHADPCDLISALVKLYRDNASTLTPDRVHSAFYDSHPAAVVRIARLRQLAAQRQPAAV